MQEAGIQFTDHYSLSLRIFILAAKGLGDLRVGTSYVPAPASIHHQNAGLSSAFTHVQLPGIDSIE
jgi:hypothetical protein